MLVTLARLAPVSALLAPLIGAAALAQNGLQGDLGGPAAEKARPSLIAETASIAPGETILIGVTFDIEPGWHTYWHGRNDTVPGPLVEFSVPEGFHAGPLRWPAPHRYESAGGLLDHVYERQVTLMAPLTAPDEIKAESIDVTARVNWTVCSDICLMADGVVRLSVPVSDSAPPGPHAVRFAAARRRLPRPLRPGDDIGAERAPGRIEIRAAGASRLAFYPHEEGPELANILRDGESRSGALTLHLREGASADEQPQPLAGVLEVWREARDETELIELRITTDGRAEPVEHEPLPRPPPNPADGA